MLYFGKAYQYTTKGFPDAMFVLPDYADPLQYYFLPNTPHIAANEDGTPAIQLLVYRANLDEVAAGAEDAVAFLSLDCDVGFPADQIKNVQGRLQSDLNLTNEPALSPIFFRTGGVRFLLLDAQAPDPGKEKDAQPTAFVSKVYATAVPSLYGDNRAIFQAMLPKKGADALAGALTDGGMTPIGVIYDLTFAGLQPAYKIKVTVNWHSVYTHFSEMHGYESCFTSDEVTKATDDLIEKKVINIEDVIEGVGDEAAKPDHDAVVDLIRHYIFDTFFKETLSKDTPAGESVPDQGVKVMQEIAEVPFSIFGKSTYERKEMTDDELRTLNFDYSVIKAAERSIHPQAHMSTMFQGTKLTKDQLVKVVTESDLWRTISFQVFANAAWDLDGIVAITVDMEYPNPDGGSPNAWTAHLTKQAPSDKRLAWLDPRALDSLRYKYQVVFAPDAIPGPSTTLEQDWQSHQGLVLTVEPNELYRKIDAEVIALDHFPFDRYPAVHAFIRFRDEDGSFSLAKDGVLSASNKKFDFHCRARHDAQAPTEVRLQFPGGDVPFDTGWMPMEADSYVVSDPHPSTLNVRVLVAGDRKKIQTVVVALQYEDDANQVMSSGSLTFDSTTINTVQSWSVHLADPTKQMYQYAVTMTYTDGGYFQTGWIESKAPTLAVGPQTVQLLEVEVSLAGKADMVDQVKVHLQYDDNDNNVHEAMDAALIRSGDAQNWRVNLKDPERQSYSYTVTWLTNDGFDRKLGPIQTTERYLAIPGSPPGA
jgi:hypothetical protein